MSFISFSRFCLHATVRAKELQFRWLIIGGGQRGDIFDKEEEDDDDTYIVLATMSFVVICSEDETLRLY